MIAYRTLEAGSDAGPLRRALERGEIEAVTFASGSAVRSFARRVGFELLRSRGRRTLVVSIGPSTSEALRALGAEPDEEGLLAVHHPRHRLVEVLRV